MQRKIITWIRKQVKESSAKGVIFGLSGGLDSAVTAALCSQALDRKRVLALILPCGNQRSDVFDAYLVAKHLKIKTESVDLTPLYKACLRIFPKAQRLAQANLKVRLRMLTLYYFANKLNYLVCGTSNKSELLTGYFTKYGDGAADILPLGDLLKSQVKELAVELNLPERIINKTPTAGLWPGQTDESELGIRYAQLDDILLRLMNNQKQLQSSNLVNRVKHRMKASEHKRPPPQICRL